MKSALELAMEKTKDIGGGESKPLTEAQKGKIAEIRRIAAAKIAELKIMMDSKASGGVVSNHADAEEDRENFIREKAKIEEDMEHKINMVRQEG